MKRFVLLVLILITGLTVFSQGIEFQKERYAEVLEMAKKQNKLVFIDIYTSWCGPCKHMADNVFPQAKVGEYYNAHFLNLQLDAEKSEDGKMVAKTFGVSAYPTFLLLTGTGNWFTVSWGVKPWICLSRKEKKPWMLLRLGRN